MCDDYDGGDSGIDISFDDTSLDAGATESFDVDSVMDAGGDDFSQFETPAEPIDTDIATDFDDGVIADPVEGEIEQIEIPDEAGTELVDSESDVNSIMDSGEDDFEQFEIAEESADVPTDDTATIDETTDTPIETEPENVEVLEVDEPPSGDISTVEVAPVEEAVEMPAETEPDSIEILEVDEPPSEDIPTDEVVPVEEVADTPTETEPDSVEVVEPSTDIESDVPVNQILEAPETSENAFEESQEQQEGIDVAESTPIREYDDFEQSVMLDNPDFYEAGSFYQQGLNEYGYQGTCGPTSQANAINEVLGTNEFTENKILDTAVENGLCNISDFPEDCGGTTTEQFMELYDKVNEQTGGKIETELYEYDNALGLNEAAAKLDEGSVLNVAVDSYALWGEQRSFADPAGGFVPDDFYSDHWITVTGAQRDELGNVTGFDVIDSGGGVNYVTAQQYQDMCFGTEEHKVIDPTCIAVSKKDMVSDVPAHPPDSSQTTNPNWFQRIFGKRGDK